MPLYDYRCPSCGQTVTLLRRHTKRLEPVECECGAPMEWRFPLAHVPPDGIYSYAPNIGSAEGWERKQAKIKEREERKAERLG